MQPVPLLQASRSYKRRLHERSSRKLVLAGSMDCGVTEGSADSPHNPAEEQGRDGEGSTAESLATVEAHQIGGDKVRPSGFCPEKRRLADAFLRAIKELHALQNEQIKAVIAGDPDFSRFDLLISAAQQKKDNAKYIWMAHVEAHHCEGA